MTIPRIPSYTMPTGAEFPSNRVDGQVEPTIAAWAQLMVGDEFTTVSISNGYFISASEIIKDAPTSAEPIQRSWDKRTPPTGR